MLARIRDGRTADAVRRLTAMQRGDDLSRIAEVCREELQAGDIHAVFLAEVDRLLEARELDTVWSFLEALRVLFPDSGRDLAARCLSLARLYQEAGRWSEARDRLAAARVLAPTWEDPALALAEAHERRGEAAAALEIYRQAHADFPESSAVQRRLAEYLLQHGEAGDTAEAVAAAREAVELTGRRDPAVLDLLVAALPADDPPAPAREALQEATALDPPTERQDRLEQIRPAATPTAPETRTGVAPHDEAGAAAPPGAPPPAPAAPGPSDADGAIPTDETAEPEATDAP